MLDYLRHFLVLFILPFTLAHAAVTQREMSLIDLLEVPALNSAQLSADGKQIIFVKTTAHWASNKNIGHLWRVNSDGSNLLQMTDSKQGESDPIWSPDGKKIAFLSNRDNGKAGKQIFIINTMGGEARPLSTQSAAISNIKWSNDGEYIYFTSKEKNGKRKADPNATHEEEDVYSYDETFYQEHLWRITVSNKATLQLTTGDFSVDSYTISRDGNKIIYTRTVSPMVSDGHTAEIWTMNLDGKQATQLTENSYSEQGARLSPDNKHVLYIASVETGGDTYYDENLFIIPSDKKSEPRLLLKSMPYEVLNAEWSADGNAIYFTANMGVRNELFKVDITSEKLEQLTDGKHTIIHWQYHPKSDAHLLSIRDTSNNGDLWITKTDKLKKIGLARVTHIYDYLAETFILPAQEAVQWKGQDGVTVEGVLSYPLNYKKGKRYALAVSTHGGPRDSDQYGITSWGKYIPAFAAKGYFVFSPNYRGSTGYGDDFVRDMVGGYFKQSHLDVMAGVDHLIALGLVDGEQMVKFGWSAGGHMTNKLITHTNRFKAASSGAGAVNWISMYGQSDTRIYRTPWFGGTPWQENAPIDTYWNNSPLKDIWKVKTPTLIFVGENDDRVPPPQSIELLRALTSLNIPTHLYIAPREPHGWTELRHRLFKMNRELEWFEHYARNKKHIWEKAPSAEKEEASKTKIRFGL